MNDIKRIIIVVLALAVVIFFAFVIKGQLDTMGWDRAYKYNIAIPETKQDEFNYNVDSKQGLVITNGRFNASKGVKFEEMTKEFAYVKKVHEHYTRHTYQTCDDKGSCTTHVYYSWDWSGEEDKQTAELNYMSRAYTADIFDFSNLADDINACDITEKDTSGFWSQKKGCQESWGTGYYYEDNNDRYYYKVVPLGFNATMLVDTSDGDLQNPFGGKVSLESRSIEKLKEDVNNYRIVNNVVLVIFSILVIIGACWGAVVWVMEDGKWSHEE